MFEDLPEIAAAYERALFDDLDMLLQTVPHDRLAVRWDVAVEFGMLEAAYGPAVPLDQITPSLVRCVERVPADVPAGLHCVAATTATGTSRTRSRCRCRWTS